jgi:hypothetical protein
MLELYVNPSTPTFIASINGSSVCSINSATIPTENPVAPMISLRKIAGGSRLLYVDYMAVAQQFTNRGYY